MFASSDLNERIDQDYIFTIDYTPDQIIVPVDPEFDDGNTTPVDENSVTYPDESVVTQLQI